MHSTLHDILYNLTNKLPAKQKSATLKLIQIKNRLVELADTFIYCLQKLNCSTEKTENKKSVKTKP